MAAAATTGSPVGTVPATAWRHSLLVAQRNVVRIRRTPASVASALVFPLIFLFGFFAVLERSLEAQGLDYAQYLPPVVVVQAMFFAALSSAFFLADDRRMGILERCRSLPVHPWAPLLGRVLADLARAVVSIVVLVAAALAIGFRFHAGPMAAAGFVAIALLFAVAAVAGCALVGLSAPSPEAANATLMLPYLPLLMLSSGFVPVDGFPGWLQPVVRWQPVSLTVDALRALSAGGATALPVARAVLVLVALTALFGALGARRFRGRS